jgi:hypothetical protein
METDRLPRPPRSCPNYDHPREVPPEPAIDRLDDRRVPPWSAISCAALGAGSRLVEAEVLRFPATSGARAAPARQLVNSFDQRSMAQLAPAGPKDDLEPFQIIRLVARKELAKTGRPPNVRAPRESAGSRA